MKAKMAHPDNVVLGDLIECTSFCVDLYEIKSGDYRDILPVSGAYLSRAYGGTDVWRTKVKAFEVNPYMNDEKLMTIYF